jgi:hypothetical protein
MQVLHFEYLQSNLICDPNASIVFCIPLIQFWFRDPNVSIANVVFISMKNENCKYEYCIFCIDSFLNFFEILWNHFFVYVLRI